MLVGYLGGARVQFVGRMWFRQQGVRMCGGGWPGPKEGGGNSGDAPAKKAKLNPSLFRMFRLDFRELQFCWNKRTWVFR